MAALNNKFHILIGDIGFLLAKGDRTNRLIYTREEAPAFVNKFSSGEPNYRDSTFFPHWVQLNWLNGFNQEFFDDGGKFYRSSGVDTTEAQELKLEKAWTSIGQSAAGVNVTAQENFRISASSILTDGNLVSYYPLDGNSTDYKAANNGSDTSITYNAGNGKYVQGAGFGGSSMIDLGTNASTNITGSLTYMAWVKRNGVPAGGESIMIKGDNDTASPANEQAGIFVLTNGKARVFVSDGATEKSTDSTTTITDNNWHLVSLVFTASTSVKCYVDGNLESTNSTTIPATLISLASKKMMLGAQDNAGTRRYFTGAMDEAMIFNRALTANEILVYYNSSASLTTPISSTFSEIFGTSAGKVYSWDGASTITELFDCRRVTWYDTNADNVELVGDSGGTEYVGSQSFQIAAQMKIKAVSLYLKKNAGTPGNITVRIETDHATPGKPSGTLVDSNATGTITAFTDTSYAWYTVEFSSNFTLNATTTYWIVVSIPAGGNDNNYGWRVDATSPTYTSGNYAYSTNAGSTWTAVAGTDAYFRVLGNDTSVNVMKMSDLSGSSKLYIGTGSMGTTTNGDARLYSYDGTTFALAKTFNTTNESAVCSLAEYGSTTTRMYVGLGNKAKIYSTTDMSTFTLSKTITQPFAPGFVLTMKEYNGKLYVGGGYPEALTGSSYQYYGFLYSYDDFSWTNVFPFDHTVITCMEVFDSLLFIGTIKRRVYVFNTASVDKLFDFPYDMQVSAMIKFDDKLAFAMAPTPGTAVSGHEGIYLFDRSGFHNAFSSSNRSWYSLLVFSNNLIGGNDDGYIFKTSPTTYQSSGYLQTSYDEAQLPSISKIRRDVTIMYDAMPADCSIAIAYKTDESDSSWTTLGTASTLNSTEATYTFPSGVYSKKISFKVTLSSSNSSNTPSLKKIIHKYVLSPDFKYRWTMTLICADNVIWQDGTEPVATLGTATTGATTTITLDSTDRSTPTEGFPDPNGSTMYASIINPTTGAIDQFTYTGKTSTTLTGVTGCGTNAVGCKVAVLGRDMHQKILDLKQTRQLFTFTDVDGVTYTALFNTYQSNAWSINQDDFHGGLENEVPITLLQA